MVIHLAQAQNTTIKGQLVDEKSNVIPFASILIENTRIGTTADDSGRYSISFPSFLLKNDSQNIFLSAVGYQTIRLPLKDFAKQTSIVLPTKEVNLRAVEVTAERNKDEQEMRSTQMSVITMDIKEIEHLPAIGGEVDLIKVAQLLPGISGGVEGSTGIFVRGGNADQNLVMYDRSTLYEFGHLFGFFSIFNNDMVKDFSIMKGAFPANYGGRLSSVIDVSAKDNFSDSLTGAGGIGLLSSRLMVQAPLMKGKANIIVGGRRTYIDQVAKLVDLPIPYHFHDIYGKAGYKFNNKHNIWYSIYYGKDVLKDGGLSELNGGQENTGFGYNKSNLAQSVILNSQYNSRLSSDIALTNTFFNYDLFGRFEENEIKAQSKIADFALKPNFEYQRNAEHKIQFGSEVIYRNFQPNIVNTKGEASEFIKSGSGPVLNMGEYALYGVSKHLFLDKRLAVDFGLRLSGASVSNKFYAGFEPRVASRYMLNENNSVKLSYSRMKQYLHRVSSSSVVLPTDIWYPVTQGVKPMSADQVAVGYNHLFAKAKTMVSVEAYYKHMNNIIEYKEGANLILNNEFEDELEQGKGNAYGLEFLAKKRAGKLHGWIGYTLSWSTRDFENINGGERFWAKYDRRHDVSVTATYDVLKRISLSAIWVYSSGARFTAQTGNYIVPTPTLTGVSVIPIYSKRNEISMSPSHRLDVNIVFKPKEKPNRKWYGEWHVGAYNVYNRATPYLIQIEPTSTGYKYTQPGLFGFLPYFSYNFKF